MNEGRSVTKIGQRADLETISRATAPAETRYRGAVDVKRAADLYARARTLRQIGAALGVPWTAEGDQLRRAGVTMRRGAPPDPASGEDQDVY